jgi:hypothetical protein
MTYAGIALLIPARALPCPPQNKSSSPLAGGIEGGEVLANWISAISLKHIRFWFYGR